MLIGKNGEHIRATKRHKRVVAMLRRIAKSVEPSGRSRHAAAVVKGNKLVSIGWNWYTSSPFQQLYGRNREAIFIHAEIDAIKQAINHTYFKCYGNLAGYDLYIVRVMGDGSLGLSKPCEGCQSAILAFGLSNIYYSLDSKCR